MLIVHLGCEASALDRNEKVEQFRNSVSQKLLFRISAEAQLARLAKFVDAGLGHASRVSFAQVWVWCSDDLLGIECGCIRQDQALSWYNLCTKLRPIIVLLGESKSVAASPTSSFRARSFLSEMIYYGQP